MSTALAHYKRMKAGKARRDAGFTLIEVILAAAILGLGLLSIVQVFPYGVQASQRAEDVTQAALLAQTLFEGLKNDPLNFPIIPGFGEVIIPLPGNGYDDDTNNQMFNAERGARRNSMDLNSNQLPDADFDGMPEFDGLGSFLGMRNVDPNGIDDDGDGVVDDTGDSAVGGFGNRFPRVFARNAPDGNIHYDPEPNMDEEYADGRDNDNDGLIDEDTRLASVRVLGSNLMLPLLAGDGIDNDGDGEDDDNNTATPARADGIDNDGDDQIDEGIDEEIWDGRDNDGDGMVDEDCQLARFPFSPSPLPAPYDRYSWQIRVGFVPDNGRWGLVDLNGDGIPDLGDGIDNDGDGLVDEELPDGLDMDFLVGNRRGGLRYLQGYTQPPIQDGLVDEDAIAAPLPDWRRIEVIITWGGNGEDEDEDQTTLDPRSRFVLGQSDPEDARARRQQISYGGLSWGVDEEKLDGIDNDLDGEIDEDFYTDEFVLVGFINLRNPSLSFTLKGGQPRGIVASGSIER